MGEGRQILLDRIAEEAESATPERESALRALAADIENRPPFFVDVLRSDRLDLPAVTELLRSYGTSDADPERFLKTLDNTIRYASGQGERRPGWAYLTWPTLIFWRFLGGRARCAYCAGRVSREATVCRHCGRDLPLTR